MPKKIVSIKSHETKSCYPSDSSFDCHVIEIGKLHLRGKLELGAIIADRFQNNYFEIKDVPSVAWKTEFKNLNPGVRAHDWQESVASVHDSFEKINISYIAQIGFFNRNYIVERYKRNTKYNKTGDIRSAHNEKKKNRFSGFLSFIQRYVAGDLTDPETYNWIREKAVYLRANEGETSRAVFYQQFVNWMDSNPHFARYAKLVEMRRKNQLHKWFKAPKFTKATFRHINETTTPVVSSDSVISLSCLAGRSTDPQFKNISVPFNRSSKYHGDLTKHTAKNKSVLIVIDLDRHTWHINASRPCERRYTSNAGPALGFDVNTKHNIAISTQGAIDIDRSLLDRLISFLFKTDKKSDLTSGERRLMLTYKRRFNYQLNLIAHKIVKQATDSGSDHIAMEDLQNNFKSTFAKMSDSKINVNRLSKILQLGSIKNRVGSICSREMIQFSLVPAYYTSQWCNKCGLVDKENRSTQESFKCVGCGHEANADEYSSEKIAMYVNHRQLQNAFLMQDKTGWFKPKDRLTKSYIRNVLTNLYTT